MAFTNFEAKEINCKIVYFGTHEAGKTENLRSILKATNPELKNGLLQLDHPNRTEKLFDFLPLSLGRVQDYHIKLHLFSLPQPCLFESVASVMLKGIDGFVFVADSRIEKLVENIEALKETERLMQEEGIPLFDLPRVLQYNKRDLKDIVPVDILARELNHTNAPEKEAVATQTVGTLETLELLTRQILQRLAPQH